jgi:hypothetical protein
MVKSRHKGWRIASDIPDPTRLSATAERPHSDQQRQGDSASRWQLAASLEPAQNVVGAEHKPVVRVAGESFGVPVRQVVAAQPVLAASQIPYRPAERPGGDFSGRRSANE